MPSLISYLTLALAMMLTGINIALGKAIIGEMTPASFTLLRCLLASLCLVPLALTERDGWKSLMALRPRQWLEIIFLALFGVVGFTTLMLIGVQYTTAINAGVIASALPAAIALLSALVLGEIITARTALSIGFAVIGIACINFANPVAENEAAGGLNTLFGNAMILAAVCSEAVFVILTRRYSSLIPPWTLTMIVHLIAIPVSLPVLFWQDGGWLLPDAGPTFWLLAVYYIITSSVLSFYLWCVGIKTVPASTGALFTALVPTTALAVAVLALGESLVMLQLVGLAAVLLSLAVGLRPTRSSQGKETMKNLITDIEGLKVGNATDRTLKSGTTALVCDHPMIASCMVLGGAPEREIQISLPLTRVSSMSMLLYCQAARPSDWMQQAVCRVGCDNRTAVSPSVPSVSRLSRAPSCSTSSTEATRHGQGKAPTGTSAGRRQKRHQPTSRWAAMVQAPAPSPQVSRAVSAQPPCRQKVG